jgi:hypothetical protein
MSWPAFRTPPRAGPGWAAYVGASLITLIAPVLLGAILSVSAGALFGTETEAGLGALLFTAGFFLAFSFYLSWTGLILAIPLAILAFRHGWAGWAMAVLAGISTGAVIYTVFGMEWFITMPAGALFGAVFWLSMRWLSPRSFSA